MLPKPEQDLENTRNVLVIFLGWGGANPRHLSKYNKIYKDYEDYIVDKNKLQNDGLTVNMTIKQYIAPVHMIFLNVCMLEKWASKIVDTIENHRNSFGSTSYVLIHAFSTGGTMALCALNDAIIKNGNEKNLYYDAIIYDSVHLGALSIFSSVIVLWQLLKIQISLLCNNICCTIIFFILFIIFTPVVMIFCLLYVIITCSMDYLCCHDKKILGYGNRRILTAPMLVLGSDDDRINPMKRSMPFITDRINKIEEYVAQQEENVAQEEEEEKEDSILLSVDIKKYDSQFIQKINKYYIFENSQHVQHYKRYPKQYQTEVTQFLDFCLSL